MKSNKTKKTNEIFEKLVNGVEKVINNGEYEKFLKFCKHFHKYSFNNIVLIFSQREDATMVAGFKTWQKMNRKLKKGAKGIQIMFPMKRTYTKKIDGQSSLLDDDNEKDTKTIEYFTYRPTYVFDVSDTVGEPLPMESKNIDSDSMIDFFNFLKEYSPYHVEEDELYGGCNGYWNSNSKKIVLKKWLSVDDKTSVLLHELTHAFYDDFNYKEDRDLSETFVESVAYIVADYFGLDTSSCSFNYITGWADGDITKIIELGDKIQKSANDFIKKLEDEYNNKNIRICV